MARIIPIRPASVVQPRRTGLRAWFRRMRNRIDRLLFQLIRLPSRRAAGAGETGQEGRAKDNNRR